MCKSPTARLLLLLALCLGGVERLCADADRVVVIYPDTEEPAYRIVFRSLVDGIKQRVPEDRLQIHSVDPERPQPAELKQWLGARLPKAVITLGRKAFEDYQSSGYPILATSGAIDLSPSLNPNAHGISLSVDPDILLETLEKTTPTIRRVFVVFNPEKDQWLIERAKTSATQRGLELVPMAASDLATATKTYWDIFKCVEPDRDALWLPLDSKLLDDENVLPFVLEQSWYRRFVVISNSLAHAKLGALIAVYPDNEHLGQHLAERALRSIAEPGVPKPDIEPLREVKRAINKRFADHFGIDLQGELRTYFDTVFKSDHAD